MACHGHTLNHQCLFLLVFQNNVGFSADDVISSHLSNIILSHSSPSLVSWFKIYIYIYILHFTLNYIANLQHCITFQVYNLVI